MSFLRDVRSTLFSRAAVLVIGLVRAAVVARWLLPEGRGAYAVLLLIPATLLVVMPLGLNFALTYHLRQGTFSRQRLAGIAVAAATILGALGYGLSLAGGATARDTLLAGLPFAWFALASLTLPLGVGQRYWTAMLIGSGRIPLSNKIDIARGLFNLLFILIALPLLNGGIVGVLVAVLVAELVSYLVSLRLASEGIRLRPRVYWQELGPMLGYGLQVYVFNILIFLNYRLDVALLRVFRDFEEVGFYVTAVVVAELLWKVPNAFGFVLFPTVAGATLEQRNRLTPFVCRVSVAVIGLGCVATAVLASPLVQLVYGSRFAPAALPVAALLPGILSMSVQNVLGADIGGRGFPGRLALAAAAGLGVNLALNIWWIPLYGAVGAAMASSVSYTVIAAVVAGMFVRLTGLPLSEVLVLRRRDVSELLSRLRRR